MRYLKYGLVVMTVLALAFAATTAFAKKNKGIKNVIIMISDGWGVNQIDATSMYQYGKTGGQVYEKFPCKTSMSTYMAGDSYYSIARWSDFDYIKSDATDSAAAATTMSTGIKTYSGAIGVDVDKNDIKHALEYAEELGKATGVVSSVEFSHATPAAFVAHNVSRSNYSEIANEMIYESAADVIMGAGNPCVGHDGVYNGGFDGDGNPTFTGCKSWYGYIGGEDTWAEVVSGSVLGADANGDGVADEWAVVRTLEDFQALMSGETPDRVLGIPNAYQTLQYNRPPVNMDNCVPSSYGGLVCDPVPYYTPFNEGVPTLEEMTIAALNVLDNDPDGLFLMVEGGAVDWAGHGNYSARLIEEQIDFNRAVEAAVAWVKANSNWGETLFIVTGDHETGYLDGPGSDPTWEPLVNNGAGNLPGMEWHSGSHTNQLIPFYAKGSAHRFFKKAAKEGDDPVQGSYMDNTNIGQIVIDLFTP
ncbi:MAG: alkaline phosphatase [Deltaproteobacteria bacterium]|nr:alkaline phosphatase [Deltaproteobacteria bacterium]